MKSFDTSTTRKRVIGADGNHSLALRAGIERKATMKQRWNEAVAKAKGDEPLRGIFNTARNALMASGVKQNELPPVNVGFFTPRGRPKPGSLQLSVS